MIADDEVHLCTLHITLHVVQVDEALITLGMLGALGGGHHGSKLQSQQLRIDHLVLGRAGMDVATVESDLCRACVEVLVLDAANGTTVGGVGIVCAEALDVKEVGAAADLLVGGEADLHGGVVDAGGDDALHGSQDLSNARLVVSAQQGGAVGDDQVLAVVIAQAGEIGLGHGQTQRLVQDDVTALVVDDAGLDVGTGAAGCGVHVGDQTDDGQALVTGNSAVDIAVLIHKGIGDAHSLHFGHQFCAQDLLLLGGGAGGGLGIGLGVEGNIAQEALGNSRHFMILLMIKKSRRRCGGSRCLGN